MQCLRDFSTLSSFSFFTFVMLRSSIRGMLCSRNLSYVSGLSARSLGGSPHRGVSDFDGLQSCPSVPGFREQYLANAENVTRSLLCSRFAQSQVFIKSVSRSIPSALFKRDSFVVHDCLLTHFVVIM